jgi:two-component system, cell cycle response regulator
MYQRKILIVDDDSNLCRMTKLFLEKIGHYQVEALTDSTLAIPRARTFRPDAMLLDIEMPGKDGADLAAEMEADPALRHIPIMFLTGLVPQSDAGKHEVICGGRPFLAKPMNPTVLINAVGRLLGSAKLASA